ncbi:protein of unknown function [Taphrina deformans PYCC 5710]|uniref:GRAM domain-containing protein n=1 Tax=Taphrina deformans (strain PYCC 5710 / ATCC 11124 / CBS 356.35 / IMI 108563 / JCM 9778 / NBRC 8474) TaxID=1097556 RepID=R4X9G9_TAPDE|nr:protein of unknown function [Taphrina deformans PYCC 5710]|eukprot:CCG80864.1 protein of unknown function [Taphrina deformans PYCC 5710]
MSLSWTTSTGFAQGPTPASDDEHFTAFPSVTSQLTSFTPVNGTLYLSTYRVLFVESPKPNEVMESVPLKQLNIPLQRWVNPTIGEIRPTPGGGLQLSGGIILRAKFIFNEGGIERFHKALEAAFATARERHRNRAAGAPEDILPVYESVGEGNGVPPTYD